MGDSYAAGIGAGSIDHYTDACLRYLSAYGPVLQNDAIHAEKFNYVACVGETFDAIIKNQFIDSTINPYTRPVWGDKPEFVTLSMGGNDIGFKELVTRCIYDMTQFTSLDCQTVIGQSRAKLEDPDFITGAVDVINKAIQKAQSKGLPPSFKVFVVGFAQFFNEQRPQCDTQWLYVPKILHPISQSDRGANLTTPLRQQLNLLARDLNIHLKTAVMRANITSPNQAFFVDWDAQYTGHRFCDRDEPNPADPETWFFTFDSTDETKFSSLQPNFPAFYSFLTGKQSVADEAAAAQLLAQGIGNDEGKGKQGVDNGVGWFRVFHPKSVGHQTIEAVLRTDVQRVIADNGAGGTESSTSVAAQSVRVPEPTAQAPPPTSGTTGDIPSRRRRGLGTDE